MDAGRIAVQFGKEDFGTAGREPAVWFEETEGDWSASDGGMEFFREFPPHVLDRSCSWFCVSAWESVLRFTECVAVLFQQEKPPLFACDDDDAVAGCRQDALVGIEGAVDLLDGVDDHSVVPALVDDAIRLLWMELHIGDELTKDIWVIRIGDGNLFGRRELLCMVLPVRQIGTQGLGDGCFWYWAVFWFSCHAIASLMLCPFWAGSAGAGCFGMDFLLERSLQVAAGFLEVGCWILLLEFAQEADGSVAVVGLQKMQGTLGLGAVTDPRLLLHGSGHAIFGAVGLEDVLEVPLPEQILSSAAKAVDGDMEHGVLLVDARLHEGIEGDGLAKIRMRELVAVDVIGHGIAIAVKGVARYEEVALHAEGLRGDETVAGKRAVAEVAVLEVATREVVLRQAAVRDGRALEDGVLQAVLLEQGILDGGMEEVGTEEIAVLDGRMRELGVLEVRRDGRALEKTRVTQDGIGEVALLEVRSPSLHATEVCAEEVGLRGLDAVEVGGLKLRGAALGTGELGTREVGSCEVGTVEDGAAEVLAGKVGSLQRDVAEVPAGKLYVLQAAGGKVGLLAVPMVGDDPFDMGFQDGVEFLIRKILVHGIISFLS